jgi:hypothetical protein
MHRRGEAMTIEVVALAAGASAVTFIGSLFVLRHRARDYKAESAIGPYQVTVHSKSPMRMSQVRTWESLDGKNWFQSESGEPASRRVTKVCMMRLEMERRREAWSEIVAHHVSDEPEADKPPAKRTKPMFVDLGKVKRITVDGKTYSSEQGVYWYAEPELTLVKGATDAKLCAMWQQHRHSMLLRNVGRS